MSMDKGNGRGVGILMIVQMATALILSFVLMDAVKKGYPSFLETAAANAATVRAGVVVATVGAALTVWLGIAMLRPFSEHSRPAAILFLGACSISASMDLVHNGTILSMLSAGEQYSFAAGADTALYQAWGIAAASARRSAHIMQLVAVFAWIFSFYFLLLKNGMVPRVLAGLGILGIVGQFTGVTLMMFLGSGPITYLAVPLAPIHLIAAVYIIAKGFAARQPVAL